MLVFDARIVENTIDNDKQSSDHRLLHISGDVNHHPRPIRSALGRYFGSQMAIKSRACILYALGWQPFTFEEWIVAGSACSGLF